MKIGLIDYGAGNLHSVQNALSKLDIACELIRSPEPMQSCDALILPGVGACGNCVRQLMEQALWSPLKKWLLADKPYFGICLGYQILFDHSEEFDGTDGLGVLPGRVVKFPAGSLKVPHMGWNTLQIVDASDPLWEGLPQEPYVYFVHSYFPQPEDENIVSAWTEYGIRFAAAIRKGNTVATQFHPEKSQAIGLQLLRNFVTQATRRLTVQIERC